MQSIYQEDQTFDKISYKEDPLPKGEYEGCAFLGCDFSAADLSRVVFSECEFAGCNLGMANITSTAFRNVKFKESKLLGLRFEQCNPFLLELDFDRCVLNLASFYRLKLKNTHFSHCSLHEVDFFGADLSNAVFDGCDLRGAIFDATTLERADFLNAYNYIIDPEKNRIKKAKFSQAGLAGLLARHNIVIQ